MTKPKIIIAENQSAAVFNNVNASEFNSFVCEILERAAASNVVIDMFAQSPVVSEKICAGFTFEDKDTPKLLSIVNSGNTKTPPLINGGNVKITVKTAEMTENVGFASKFFAALKAVDCVPILVATGIDEISALIYERYASDLERELRKIFA